MRRWCRRTTAQDRQRQNWVFCAAQPRRTRHRQAAHSRQGGCPTVGLPGSPDVYSPPPGRRRARRSFFRSGRDAGGRNRLAGAAGGQPGTGSRGSRPRRARAGTRRRGEDAGRLPRGGRRRAGPGPRRPAGPRRACRARGADPGCAPAPATTAATRRPTAGRHGPSGKALSRNPRWPQTEGPGSRGRTAGPWHAPRRAHEPGSPPPVCGSGGGG
jgi:hypothetical protein